ncbi:MAG: hypothetical protein K0Q95_443 [Bacteroidota bacterium]|jgi:hypothetical protein|nr:hypothetical protein [Bacteroidota bacterium]
MPLDTIRKEAVVLKCKWSSENTLGQICLFLIKKAADAAFLTVLFYKLFYDDAFRMRISFIRHADEINSLCEI